MSPGPCRQSCPRWLDCTKSSWRRLRGRLCSTRLVRLRQRPGGSAGGSAGPLFRLAWSLPGRLACCQRAWTAAALDVLSAWVATAGAALAAAGVPAVPMAALAGALLTLDVLVRAAAQDGLPDPAAWRAVEQRLEAAVLHQAAERPLLANSLWRLLAKVDARR